MAVGGGPWCRSLGPACARVSWGLPWARPWRRVLPGACRRGWLRRVGGGGARSRLVGRRGVVEGLGSRHTRRVAYLIIIGEARAAAARSRTRSKDQLELDALIKYHEDGLAFCQINLSRSPGWECA